MEEQYSLLFMAYGKAAFPAAWPSIFATVADETVCNNQLHVLRVSSRVLEPYSTTLPQAAATAEQVDAFALPLLGCCYCYRQSMC